MKTFIYILERKLKEKYPNVDFKFYISRRTKYVHMGLNQNLLSIRKHRVIISDNEELWNPKRQDNKFKSIMPLLISTTKWKFDYIIFKKKLTFKCKK